MALLNAKELEREVLIHEIEARLLLENSNIYRSLFIQYSFHPKNGFILVLSLFPINGGVYTVVTGKSQQMTYDSVNKILQNHINQ